jgi:hypothetical protein
MRHRAVVGCVAILTLVACSDGPSDPPDDEPEPPASASALVIAPSALLLAPGEAQQLRAFAVDADGDSTEVAATFESSSPGVVAVSGAGLATGGATLGSAQIVARSGSLVSAPVLALRATPVDGALLVSDAQVIGTITAVDPTAPYQPGWRYRVRLRGVTPAPGQVVLASGGAPVGGRVVSAAAVGGDVDVELELIPINGMFAQISFTERLSLEHASVTVPAALRGSFRLDRQPGGGIRLSAREKSVRYVASATRPSLNLARVEQAFDLGPFECKAEVPPAFVFPLTVDAVSFELNPNLAYDITISDGTFQRAIVTGSITPRITASPRITAALEAKAECKIHVATLNIPVGGPLSLLIGGKVPFGVGFEIGAKASFGQLGYDAFVQADVTTQFGIDCAAGCEVVSTVTSTAPTSFFKPVLPSLTTGTRFELGASGFGWAELAIGNALLEAFLFKAVEVKAGLEQKLELAGRDAQAADASYASTFALKPVIEAKAASNLAAIANLLSINLATLTFAPELPTLAKSPHGTFAITPTTVAPGGGTQIGQLATFTVTLSDVNYLGAYAVEGVEIRWRKTDGTSVSMAPGRPGCTDLAAAQSQTSFSCQTDFTAADTGSQTFYAFAKTRIYGVPIPLPLEIAADAKATLVVGGGVTIAPTTATLASGATQQFEATVAGIQGAAVTWSATGGTLVASGNAATYTAGTSAGTYSITATSVQDPSKSAVAAIQVTSTAPPPPPATVVKIIRDSVLLHATQTWFFSAEVTPSAMNAVTWSATGGTITQTSPSSGGQYRAGTEPGTYVVTARSVDDPSASATAKVIIVSHVFGRYTGLWCFTPEGETGCTPNQSVTSYVTGPISLNGTVYVDFRGHGPGCGVLARLVSSSGGGATLVGTEASFCNSGVSGNLNDEGSWTGTFSGSTLTITDREGLYAFSLTKDP